MRKLPLAVTIGALLCAAVSQAQAASFTVFANNQPGWAAAVGPYSTEDFGAPLNTDWSVTSSVGYVDATNQWWHDRLTSTDTTTFSFANPIIGFGGDWDLSPGGAGMGVAFDVKILTPSGWQSVGSEVPSNYVGQFWGFKSSDAFTQVQLLAGTQSGIAETMQLDNMVYAAPTAPADTPEPCTLALLGGGLALAGLGKRRRRAAA